MTNDERSRYSRHIILSEIGMAGQQKLNAASVLVIGAGGLGCPLLQYLTAAGVGNIGIVDDDRIDISNLQRQILYTTEDVGQFKAEVAARRLLALNPHIRIKPYVTRLTKDNALDILKDYHIIVDGTDNFATRYLVNDACVMLNKPLVYGAIYKFEGQVSVFNWTDANNNQGPTYRCLFPEPPPAGSVPNCSEIGVLGVLPGIIGTYQANEVIKMITGVGKVLSGELLMMDLLTMTSRKIKVQRTKDAAHITALTDYEVICEVPDDRMKTISPEELSTKLAQGEPIQLIDVRESYEFDICHIPGSVLIPMNTIQRNIHKIDRDKPVVVLCHHGMRSAQVIDYLKNNTDLTNLYNLDGGIHAWAEEVDQDMPVY